MPRSSAKKRAAPALPTIREERAVDVAEVARQADDQSLAARTSALLGNLPKHSEPAEVRGVLAALADPAICEHLVSAYPELPPHAVGGAAERAAETIRTHARAFAQEHDGKLRFYSPEDKRAKFMDERCFDLMHELMPKAADPAPKRVKRSSVAGALESTRLLARFKKLIKPG